MRRYRFALFSAGIVLIVVLCSSFASRTALGLVVASCTFNYSLTNSAFPCLKVVRAPQSLDGYAILREPGHRERTILTPLAGIDGIEDARLLTADAPNYFSIAWNERSAVMSAHPDKDPWQDSALAINAASNRTQDHLHIHIGCVATAFKSLLNKQTAAISDDEFRRFTTRLDWRTVWIKTVEADDLSKINLFRLVSDEVPGARGNMRDVAIGVVGAPPRDGKKGFYVLAQLLGYDTYGSAEDLLDPRCRR